MSVNNESKPTDRLIYARDILNALIEHQSWGISAATKFVNELPTAGLPPVVRGNWQHKYHVRSEYTCSNCGTNNRECQSEYCPQCGARMNLGATNK